jgi:pentatricopeptide repeat protein
VFINHCGTIDKTDVDRPCQDDQGFMLILFRGYWQLMSTIVRRATSSQVVRNLALLRPSLSTPCRAISHHVRNQPVYSTGWHARNHCGLCARKWHKRPAGVALTHVALRVKKRLYSSNCLAQGESAVASSHCQPQNGNKKLDRNTLLGLLDQYHHGNDGVDRVDGANHNSYEIHEHTPSRRGEYSHTTELKAYGPARGSVGDGYTGFQAVVQNKSNSLDELYSHYRALPQPNILHIDAKSRELMLRRLSVPDVKTEKAMLRYLSVLEDMKQAGLHIDLHKWNSAVHLAGRSFGHVTSQEVEVALRMWKEMEQQASMASNVVTFNILFDIATKAGQFALAEMILGEMRTRKISFSRFSYVSLIYYHGIRGDGASIRRTYRSLVEADQIVDSVVLNCVIASLLRAGELPAAMNVYTRMRLFCRWQKARPYRQLAARKPEREIGKSLDKLANKYRGNTAMIQQLQDNQSISPDVHTYIILIQHHVSCTGELQTVAALLDEMHETEVVLEGRLFLELFRGFSQHGNKPYTLWTPSRLEDVWQAFITCLDNEMPDIYVSKWISIWILRAFEHCFGRSQSLAVWEELRQRWNSDISDLAFFGRDPVDRALRYDNNKN